MLQGERVVEPLFFSGQGRYLAFAHRGGSALWPENTLSAFIGAQQLGCTYLETDIRMSRDGEIVVFHDANLSRTTNGSGVVNEHTWQQLQQLDAAHYFQPASDSVDSSEPSRDSDFPLRGEGHGIPRLAELLRAAPRAFLNIEIKEWGPVGHSLPDAFWRFIVEHSLQDRILVAAERHDLIVRFRQLSKGQVLTGASRRECLWFWALSRVGLATRVRWEFQALQIPTHASGWAVVTPSLLKAAHKMGIAVHVWTIDKPEQMRELLASGVDGLMTDRPDRLMSIMSEFGQPGDQLREKP